MIFNILQYFNPGIIIPISIVLIISTIALSISLIKETNEIEKAKEKIYDFYLNIKNKSNNN